MEWKPQMAASMTVVLFSMPSLALDPSFYPEVTKVWGGGLPGERTHYTPDVGYPDEIPNATHGGAVYAGWSMTNGFARYWNINYNLLNLRAEPKHGLWRWKFPGAARDFWWCELGGQWSGADGFADGTDIQWSMGKVWEQIRKSPMNTVDSFGFLGRGTKLADYVIDMVPVELSTKSGASIWRNKGSSSAPKYQRMWPFGVEFYLFTAYYGWPTMLAGTPCTGGKESGDGCDSLVHQFIAMVLPSVYSTFIGLPTYGLHYAMNTECPDSCGDVGCDCDAVLVDLALEGPLNGPPRWKDEEFYLPTTRPDEAEPEFVGESPDPELEAAEPEAEAAEPEAEAAVFEAEAAEPEAEAAVFEAEAAVFEAKAVVFEAEAAERKAEAAEPEAEAAVFEAEAAVFEAEAAVFEAKAVVFEAEAAERKAEAAEPEAEAAVFEAEAAVFEAEAAEREAEAAEFEADMQLWETVPAATATIGLAP